MNKIVIIGGVTGGATAAGRIRRLDSQAEIVMLERGDVISFANCGLPYYIGGVVDNSEKLLVTDAKTFGEYYNIDVRVKNEVKAINTSEKTIRVFDSANNKEYTESYDKLLISTGAEPAKFPFVKTELPGVFTLRSYSDSLEIRNFIDTRKPKTAIVIGGGFIGLEMVENLMEHGIKVTLLDASPQVFPPVDPEIAQMVEEKLESEGVKVHTGVFVSDVYKLGERLKVTLKDESGFDADMVFIAVGTKPDSSLALEAGLKTNERGFVKVNAQMETSVKDVYAVGDIVEIPTLVNSSKTSIQLAGPTQMQSRIAADNICGKNSEYKGVLGSSILKLFDMSVAVTGFNSQQAKAAGIDFGEVTVSSVSHATYIPGAEEFSLKVLYEKGTGRVIGAQAIGGTGVDKRIDIMATAIYAKLTGEDLEQLHLAYAPPFSIPRDAVNIAGGIIKANVEKGR